MGILKEMDVETTSPTGQKILDEMISDLSLAVDKINRREQARA